MILRRHYLDEVRRALSRNPVCALLGPRQCGKTTLARQIAAEKRHVHVFDLEKAFDQARLEHAEMVLSDLRGLVIIDEIQRRPNLFALLRPLADRPRCPARFLILGSAAPSFVRGVSESLAGRVGFVHLGGFEMREVGPAAGRRLWLRGGFPRSYLAASLAASLEWRNNLVQTILERDLPQLGIRVPAVTLRRFWMMLAHCHGQAWNGSDIARSLAVSEPTVRGYLDILTGAYLVRQLPPWFENISKRQYRAPKTYIRDSGLLHALLSIPHEAGLQAHHKYGSSWEGFALEQVLPLIGAENAYYWGTHAGAELDLMFFKGGRRYGVEFKCGDAPRMTKSLHIAIEDLNLERAWIIYPGERRYPVHERVEALPLAEAPEQLGRPGGSRRAR